MMLETLSSIMRSEVLIVMKNLYSLVDNISERIGKMVCWINVILIITINCEVIARYAFNAPMMWSYAMSFMLGGAIYVLGQPYVTRYNAHVRVDLFYVHFPKKIKLIIDIAFGFIFSIPVLFILNKVYWEDAMMAYKFNEKFSQYCSWAPVSWPFKVTLAIGFSLLFIQVLVNLLRDIKKLRNKNKKGVELKLSH